MKKIEKAQLFLAEHLDLFQCPVCQEAFKQVDNYQLTCPNNHQFDLSKKGTLHFLLKPMHSEYTRDMLLARQRIAQDGFWHGLLEEVFEHIETVDGAHLDVGSGEGSQSDYLKQLGLSGSIVAFDISKEGINLAAATYEEIFFLVADLAHSPFSADSFDTILNILSPSNYQEFKRILKPGGLLIKVVPGADYLKELRALGERENNVYSNQDVVDKFAEHFPVHNQYKVEYTVELAENRVDDFIEMTPLGWNTEVDAASKAGLRNITIDLLILEGKME